MMDVQRPGQQGDAVVARGPLEQLTSTEIVLRREDLGGRHQCGLIAILDGDEHRLQSHDGLARADVALQQAAHRAWLFHILDDLCEGTLLRCGGMEGQHFTQRRTHLLIRCKRDTGPLPGLSPLDLQP